MSVFLSTPSGWRATWCNHYGHASATISIHALRVEGDCKLAAFLNKMVEISIHALRVEGDIMPKYNLLYKQEISIHALRVEGDNGHAKVKGGRVDDFYPRPPGGGRQSQLDVTDLEIFISIHALRVEGDGRHHQRFYEECYFYPRPPGGGRRPGLGDIINAFIFLSTPSGWRATIIILPKKSL